MSGALYPGLRLRSGRYRVLSRLRTGATAQVWRALDVRDGVEVAIKAVPADAGGADAVEHEAEAVARVRHPGAVRVLATFEEAGHGLIVMELAAASLADHVDAHGPLDGATTRCVARALAEVLAAAHAAGVVHRDVKPHNVLVMADGSVRLADFGIARVHARGHTRTGALLGTLPFMAPEQRRDARDVRPATDRYALAALIAWMRTGAAPGDLFVPEVLDALRGRLRAAGEPDDALFTLIRGWGRYDPDAREGADAAEVLHGEAVAIGVGRGVEGEDGNIAQNGGLGGPAEGSDRKSAWVWAGVAAIAVAVVGCIAWAGGVRHAQEQAAHPLGALPRCKDAPRQFVDRVERGPRETMDADIADVDGDGKLDVLFANTLSESTTVWWGQTDGLPREHTEIPSGRHVTAPSVADVNADGIPDLLIPLYNDAAIGIVHGLGNHQFAQVERVFQDPSPYHMAASDLDSDSLPDLVLTSARDTNVYLRRGAGLQAVFSDQTIATTAPGVSAGRPFPTKTGTRVWWLHERDVLWKDITRQGTAGPLQTQELPIPPGGVIREAGHPEGAVALVEDGSHMTLVRVGSDVDVPCVLGERKISTQVHVVGDLDQDGVPDLIESQSCQGCESNHIFVRGER